MATLPRARRQRPSWPRSVLATAVSLLRGGRAIAARLEGRPRSRGSGLSVGLPRGGGEDRVLAADERGFTRVFRN